MSADKGLAYDGAAGPSAGSSARSSVVRRALRLGRRLIRSDSRTLYASLSVADVNLDDMTASPLPPLTDPVRPPEGVHALVWLHGVPIAEVTAPGVIETVLRDLPAVARQQAAAAVDDHRCRDGNPIDERSPCTHQRDWWSRISGSELTVVVCTRDRADDLDRCLRALGALTVDVAEVVVVDNASDGDGTRRVVDAHPAARYVREPRLGVGWARNRALLECRTSLIAFVDDDALVHPRWAEALLMAFDAHPDAAAITGLVPPAELATPTQVVFEAAGGFGRGFRQRRLKAASTDPRDVAKAVYHIGAMGTGANMAFQRERIVAIGGFDPALGAGTPTAGGDDHEALCRLLAAGDLIVYEPGAVVRHRHRRTMAELRRQRRGDGAGSASMLVGAGRKLGPAHHRQWKRVALAWMVKNTAWTLAGSLLRPAARPMSLTLATATGWLLAVVRDYYGRALEQARAEARAHPEQPTLLTQWPL